MKIDVLLGLQYGDEGKGKVVDVLAPKYSMVSRFQGGPNAGHTLEFDGQKFVLHQIPSGIFRNGIRNVIGNGVVIDPVILKREISGLEAKGITLKNSLFISKKAHLIIPTHRLLDAASEKAKGDKKIGSTLKGIGPTYQDKIGRHGLRIGDILSNNFNDRYQALKEMHLSVLQYHGAEFELESLEQEFFEALNFIRQYRLVDSEYLVNDALQQEQAILAEGAQGSLLDIDFGTYPFVTSSSTMAAGACTGLGVAPSMIGEVFGIMKAYTTRVGSGPFPTELNDDDGERLRKLGNEFGSTTGRPRRCGWLDIPALRYAIMINGVTQLFLMKVDVLNDFDEIKICTGYTLEDGSKIDRLSFDLVNEKIEPIIKSVPGWKQDLTSCKDYLDLPEALRSYIELLESELKKPITIISTGPDRTQTIIRQA
jgi:adenylosuccinate synthase